MVGDCTAKVRASQGSRLMVWCFAAWVLGFSRRVVSILPWFGLQASGELTVIQMAQLLSLQQSGDLALWVSWECFDVRTPLDLARAEACSAA